MKFTIPLPPSLNATYKTGNGNYYKTGECREWEEQAGWVLKKHCRSSYDPTDQLYVGIELFLKRDRDIDNSIKIILDLFQKMKVYPNDKQITHLNVKKYQDKKFPHCEVEIVEL